MGSLLFAAALSVRLWQSNDQTQGEDSDTTLVLRVRAGPYFYWGKRDGGRAFKDAVAAFGAPSSRGQSEPRSRVCSVRWESRGVDVDFVGAAGCADAELRRQSWWFGMRLWGDDWMTDSGLRVGDTVTRIRELYPGSRYVSKPPTPAYWELVARRSADFGRIPLLMAQVGAGRVAAIDVPPGFVL